MSEVMSVLIADDHDIVRDAVAHVVGNELAVPVKTAKDKDTALQAIRDAGPFTVLLLDIAMPGMTSPTSVEDIVKANAPGAVVVFSGLVDEVFVRQAILNGARGYIPKTLPLKSLGSTLKLIASGQIFVPFSATEPQSVDVQTPKLSPKEISVLRLLVKGQTNKEIARALDSTEVRVKMHLRSICSRLNAKNRTQAALIAEQSGLIDPA
jgi:two-component system, NarL family, nitrate/nitrite response regulator NarL